MLVVNHARVPWWPLPFLWEFILETNTSKFAFKSFIAIELFCKYVAFCSLRSKWALILRGYFSVYVGKNTYSYTHIQNENYWSLGLLFYFFQLVLKFVMVWVSQSRSHAKLFNWLNCVLDLCDKPFNDFSWRT